MKNYKEHINEVSEFKKRFLEIERRFPDVQQFISIASRWILRAKRIKDRELRKLLLKLRRKTDIMDFSTKDFRRVQNYIDANNLHDIESVRGLFTGEESKEDDDNDSEDRGRGESRGKLKKDYNKVYQEMEKFVDDL